MAALGEHGVAEGNVQSMDLSMQPQSTREKGERPRLDGYRVARSVRVTVPELDRFGKAIAAAVAA